MRAITRKSLYEAAVWLGNYGKTETSRICARLVRHRIEMGQRFEDVVESAEGQEVVRQTGIG